MSTIRKGMDNSVLPSGRGPGFGVGWGSARCFLHP